MMTSFMAKPLFIDTSALIALLNKRDQHHEKISGYLKKENFPQAITSNLILTELMTFFSRLGGLKEALAFQDHLLSLSNVKVVWMDETLHKDASLILKKFSDQRLSFTDATSFAIMRTEGLKKALAFDEDFIKAGFECVPSRD